MTMIVRLVAFVAVFAASTGQAQLVLPSPCPVCTDEQEAGWSAAMRDGRMEVRDRGWGAVDGNTIGLTPAMKRWPWRPDVPNWWPYLETKQTVCGRVKNFHSYQATGPEFDANFFVQPYAPHDELYWAVRWIATQGEWQQPWTAANTSFFSGITETISQCGSEPCFEIEIDPDQSLHSTFFYDLPAGTSVLEDQDVCFYGPFVSEALHGWRPEIHPAEAIWWRDASNNLVGYLALIQDDSNRFGERGDFLAPPDASHWRPWAAAGRSHRIWNAFAVDAAPMSPLVIYVKNLDEYHRSPHYSGPHPGTHDLVQGDGRTHEVTYNGRTVLTVIEEADDRAVQVNFSTFCMSKVSKQLLGYITFVTFAGYNSTGQEGYQVLRIEQMPPSPVEHQTETAFVDADLPAGSRRVKGMAVFVDPTSPAGVERAKAIAVLPPAPSQPHRWISATLHRDEGVKELRADFPIVTVANEPPIGPQPPVASARYVLANGRERRLAVARNRDTTFIRDVPVSLPGELRLFAKDGRVLARADAGVALIGTFTAVTPSVTVQDPGAWSKLAAMVEWPTQSVTAPLATAVRRVLTWRLDFSTGYSGSRNGDPMPEDDSGIADVLNRALIRGSPFARRRLFGANGGPSLEWSVEIVDAQGRLRRVALKEGNEGVKGRVRVAGNRYTIELETGEMREPFLFAVHVHGVDINGMTFEARQLLGSHALVGEASSLTKQANLGFRELLPSPGPARPDGISHADGRAVTQSRTELMREVTQSGIFQFAHDGVITIGELRSLALSVRRK